MCNVRRYYASNLHFDWNQMGYAFIGFQDNSDCRLLVGFSHHMAKLNNWEAPSWMNHIYYHWSTTRFQLRSHSELPLEYCLFSALIVQLPQSANVHERLIAFKWGHRAAETGSHSWHFNSTIEFTWAKSPTISMIQFICDIVSPFLALILFKIHHLLQRDLLHIPPQSAFFQHSNNQAAVIFLLLSVIKEWLYIKLKQLVDWQSFKFCLCFCLI